MNEAEFRALVRKMRDAQYHYFKLRTSDTLRAAKDYERRVDAELADVKQPGFFDK